MNLILPILEKFPKFQYKNKWYKANFAQEKGKAK